MNRSTTRILTTHVGSLPNPEGIDIDGGTDQAVSWVVRRQREIGLDVINEGEYTKGGSWLTYLQNRLGGVEIRPDGPPQMLGRGKDREVFADFYSHAARIGTLYFGSRPPRPHQVVTGPLTYQAHSELRHEIELTKKHGGEGELFLTSTAPASIEVYRQNEYYKSEEEFVFGLADALKVEYEAIANSGLLLQIDDAWLPGLWDRIGMQMGLEAFKRYCHIRIEALNHALANIPEERIRYHLCWGSWHGPHAFDLDMQHLVDLMLSVKAKAYLFEAANARHEHEYSVWDTVKLPAGKILIPGVITHSTDIVEHPELVAQRIRRFAKRVGRENVMAGADCGFGGRTHPQIAWAKLRSLVEGAAQASKALF